MSSMVERVARAISASHYPDKDADVMWRHMIPDARAAIQAMRVPTPLMFRAAARAMSQGHRPTEKRVGVKAKHGIRYRAMIDAALQE